MDHLDALGWVTLVGMTVWWTMGFNAIIYLAGLQDISPDLYEAAEVDGASTWQQFRYVTLPGLRPVLLFVLTVTILASANMFGQSYLIDPGRARQRDPDGDHVHRPDRPAAVPPGGRGGDGLHPRGRR